MKIAIVTQSQIVRVPHLKIFRNILNDYNCNYDIICWNKEGLVDKEGIIFNYYCPATSPKIKKIYGYLLYLRFIISKVNRSSYDKLIIISPALAIVMYPYLKFKYKNKFWLDYRDVSIEQKFMKIFTKVLRISSNISISSDGFRDVLPMNFDYVLSHNFNIDIIKSSRLNNSNLCKKNISNLPIVISTIGYLRDTNVYIELIDGLKDSKNFELRFIGEGPSVNNLKNYKDINRISNMSFYGRYEICEESTFYYETDFVNIYFPKEFSNLMSNRFYNALIYHRPMIVNSNSFQAEFVKKYNLGLVVDDFVDVENKLFDYLQSYNCVEFEENCNNLLNEFLSDYYYFEKKLLEFLNIR